MKVRINESAAQEYYYQAATKMVARSLCCFLIALNEEFCFSHIRLARLIERYQKVVRSFNDYDDAESTARIRARIEDLGLKEFSDFMLKNHDIKKFQQEVKHHKPNEKQSKEIQDALKAMKGLIKN